LVAPRPKTVGAVVGRAKPSLPRPASLLGDEEGGGGD